MLYNKAVSELNKVFYKCITVNRWFDLIPGGLTSVVQPLDVCLNKPFKDLIRQHGL